MPVRYRDRYLIDGEGPLAPELLNDLDLAYEVAARVNQMVPCEGCGTCCHQSRILILDGEAEAIAATLGMDLESFMRGHLRREGDEWFFSITSPCAFLGEDRRCRIHADKPQICRDAPFLNTQFIGAVLYLLQSQRQGLILPMLGTFIMGDSPCSIKAAALVSEEIALLLHREGGDNGGPGKLLRSQETA